MASLSSCTNQLLYVLPNVAVGTEYYPLFPFPSPISKAELNVFTLTALYAVILFLLLFSILVILPFQLQLYPHSR